MAVIALDVGGTKVASAIMDNDGKIRFSHKNLLGGREGHDVGKLIVSNLLRQIEKAEYHKIKIESIGVCIPGTVNSSTTTASVTCTVRCGWERPVAAAT